MAKDVDSELAANLKAAKTKRDVFSRSSPRGANDGGLVLAIGGKVAPVMINDAKKKSGASTTVFKGASVSAKTARSCSRWPTSRPPQWRRR